MLDIINKLKEANAAYRAGRPVMSDAEYDVLVEDLRASQPDYPFLHAVEVEPENLFAGRKIQHASPMLSTEKAYDREALRQFFIRVEALALPDLRTLEYRITPKLDGLAGSRDRAHGVELATRGNGLQGEDVGYAFERGLKIVGKDMDGPGEIVIPKAFFADKVAPLGFKHSRNFMVGFIAADTVKDHHRMVAGAGMAHFVPYANLSERRMTSREILNNIEEIAEQIRNGSPYDTDGIVIEVVDPEIRVALGSTNHHHRWQIAYKTLGETAETMVSGIAWQTGRTGRVTPVIEVDPVDLSGATIRRATGHTFRKMQSMGLGVGAVVKIIRSGEVIPYIQEVIHPVVAEIPCACPSCGTALVEDGEYLACPGLECPAQSEGGIGHFFKTLGNADGFGPKALEKIVAAGFTDPLAVLSCTCADFEDMGFGPGQALNLEQEMERCKNTQVEDWRFLAAFGIRYLGRGDSKALLKAVGDLDALNGITPEQIMAVDGFADKTAQSIARDLAWRWMEIEAIRSVFLHVQASSASIAAAGITAPLQGLNLVFTGTFSVPREELEAHAGALGAKVQSSVNGKTSALVVGDKPGAGKTKKAAALGTPTWTQGDFEAKCNTSSDMASLIPFAVVEIVKTVG
ncbi:MAG: helix-hairpin-helix domain-containing protein [Acidithiobacillus sp.]